MDEIFGTEFEMSLRLPLLLHNRTMTEDRLCAIDYIITYAKDFQFATVNLHGDGYFRKCEYAARQLLASRAIKRLVLKGFLAVHTEPTGFSYSLSDTGAAFVSKFQSIYALKYMKLAEAITPQVSNLSDHDLIEMIYKHGGTNE